MKDGKFCCRRVISTEKSFGPASDVGVSRLAGNDDNKDAPASDDFVVDIDAPIFPESVPIDIDPGSVPDFPPEREIIPILPGQ